MLINIVSFKSAGPSAVRRDVDDLVRELVGGGGRAPDSNNESPISSVPGTPVMSQTSILHAPSAMPSLVGRASRLSDAASDRGSLGTTLVQFNGATDEVVHRYACTFLVAFYL